MGQLMTNQEDIDAAEKRGYARGYVAGRKKGRADKVVIVEASEQRKFIERAYMACLPSIITGGWKVGEKRTVEAVVQAAWHFANESLKQRWRRNS